MRDARTGTKPKPSKPKPQKLGPGLSGEHAQEGPKPRFAGHDHPPSPTLKQAGFVGSILDFNDHVAKIVQAHQGAFGYDPPPGLTLDIAKSPLQQNEYSFLFPPGTKKTRDLQKVADKWGADNKNDMLTDRGDGVLTRNYPLAALALGGATGAPVNLSALKKKYPNVQMGMLPIGHADLFFEALRYLDEKGGLENAVQQNGLTVEEFEREVKRGQGIRPDLAGQAELHIKGVEAQNPTDPDLQRMKRAPVIGAATTIRGAQKELNRVMGTTLPETGYFNENWVEALSNWMRSADYFHKVTERQAEDAGFGHNVAGYLKAWKAKQYSVKHHGLAGHFLNAMPLQVFGHGLGGGLIAAPIYIGTGGHDPVSTGLHALTRTAGLTLGVVGGTIEQAKADVAAGHQFVQSVVVKGRSYDDSLKAASETLKANPSWMRIFFPDMPDDPKGILRAIDEVTNLTGDIVLLGKPRFTGEVVKPGDLAGAKSSTYVSRSAHWAYDYLTKGNMGRAAEMMEGGSGANKLAAVAAPLIKHGKLTQEQFGEHLAELYATGSTTLHAAGKDFTITGPVLSSLRNKYLPTPGNATAAWFHTKNHFRDWLDAFDSSHHSILGSKANAFIGTLRDAFEHVAPASMHYFDSNLPGSIRHFIMNQKLADRAVADKYASLATKLQATENVVGMQKLSEKLDRLYRAKYPLSKHGHGDEFQATLGTEAPSIFSFPSGGEAAVHGALGKIGRQTERLNKGLNTFAKYRTRLILSTGVSLFYKHAIGDFMRLVFGGGLKGNKAAAARIDQLAAGDPALERALGVFLGRSELGETRYILGRGGTYSVPAFRTGVAFDKKDHMVAAGGQLRRLLTDDALSAYRLSRPSNLDPLVQLILRNRTYRGMWKSAKQADPAVTAEEYAQKVYDRFAAIDAAASAVGLPNVWGKGLAVVRANRGAHADEALGEFIKQNRLDFEVQSARIEAGGFDEVTGRVIGFLMTPNKKYRKTFATNVLNHTFGELTAAGMSERQALEVGTELAGRLVKYHMLDFSNRLQVEQDFRWLSWFATKHRLYWKWVMNAFLRSPGAAAVVTDVKDVLDDRGNINFSILGHKLAFPAARMLWVPGREYSEVSLDAQFIWYLVKNDGNLGAALQDAYAQVNGTGNIITRVDTGLRLAARSAKILTGHTPATYEAALQGLPEQDKERMQRDFNEYVLSYFHDHGHYPAESDVVKHVMWRATAENLWRSTLPLPVVPADNRSEQQDLVRQYMYIVDPAKRRQFLEDHPGFSDHFGVWDDPKAFLHNHRMFGRYVSALDAYKTARADLYERAKKNGMTPALVLDKRKLDSAFQKTYDMLLIEDAKYAGIKLEKGDVPGVGKTPYGPWGRLASADPQINPRHLLNALFPKLQDSESEKVYGRLQKELKAELALLNNPKYAATYPDPDELKTRKRVILQQLEVFRRYPTDALGRVQQTYQTKYVNKYWRTLDQKYEAIQELPAGDRDLAYAKLRAWRDSQDHDITINGIRFPSPIRMAWATLDPQTRNQRLRYFASKSWENLTSYEKELLGVKRDANTAKGWATFQEAYAAVAEQLHLAGESMPSNYKDVLAKDINKRVAPGFLVDYQFSKKPLYERVKVLDVVKDSRYKREWHDLLAVAGVYGGYLKSGEYSKTSTRATWRAFLKSPGFLDEYNSTPLGFRREVQEFGPNFLTTLIGG